MSEFHRVVGIDLGTTFSVVAAYNFDKQEVRVIPNRQNEPTTPSVVYVSQEGRVSVGKAAREKLGRDPNRVIFEVKRLMGEQVNGKKAMARAGDLEIDPEVVSAHILTELKKAAEVAIGVPIYDVVITVPARFKEPQKNATREAAKIAKLNPRLIINEPTAAAVAYGLDSGEPQTFVVFDFGGGTFDVSVVRIEDLQTVEILGTGGDPHLGGGDIDQAIVNWVLAKMNTQFSQDFSNNARLVGRLRLKAEQVKINLCNEKQPQEFFLESPTSDIEEINYTFTQADFERILKPLLDRAMVEVDVALESARSRHELTLADIEAFILVGGSSRIPAVGPALQERYKKPIKSNLNPDEIVAMGAARMALNYEPSEGVALKDNEELKFDPKAAARPEEITDTHIKDVVSHTLGVGLKDDVYDPLIEKDHVIPHKVVRSGYVTAYENQANILIQVYQGDNPVASSNFELGKVVIDGLKPLPKGGHQFQITFALDADGIFTGEILHINENTITPINLERGQGGMTEKKRIDLAKMVETGLITSDQAGKPPSSGASGDALDHMIQDASAMLSTLPVARQREIAEILIQLQQARAANDGRMITSLVPRLAMLLVQVRA